MRRRCAVGISDRSTDAARMRDGRLGGDAWPAGQPPPAKGEPPPAPVARSAGALGEPSLGGLVLSFGDVLGGQLLAQPGMLVVHVLHLSSRRGCWSSTRLARTARSTRIRGMKVEAGLAVSNPRRSGTPRPRSTSQSGLPAFGSSSRCSSIRLVRALAVSVAMTRQVPVGRTSRLWLWSVHQRCRLTSTASGPPSMVSRSLSILLGRVVNASYIEPWSLRQTVWECFRGRLRGRGRRRLPLGWSAQDRHRSRRRPRRRVASRRRNSGS
jgi:hypothetical protein